MSFRFLSPMAGIKHIEFWVSNIEQSLLFYKKFFSLIGREQYDTNGFRSGMTKIYFVEKEVLFDKNIGPRHICFEAKSKEEIEKVFEFLQANKTIILRGPLEYSYKGNTAWTLDFKDPDGYILELATRSHT